MHLHHGHPRHPSRIAQAILRMERWQGVQDSGAAAVWLDYSLCWSWADHRAPGLWLRQERKRGLRRPLRPGVCPAHPLRTVGSVPACVAHMLPLSAVDRGVNRVRSECQLAHDALTGRPTSAARRKKFVHRSASCTGVSSLRVSFTPASTKFFAICGAHRRARGAAAPGGSNTTPDAPRRESRPHALPRQPGCSACGLVRPRPTGESAGRTLPPPQRSTALPCCGNRMPQHVHDLCARAGP